MYGFVSACEGSSSLAVGHVCSDLDHGSLAKVLQLTWNCCLLFLLSLSSLLGTTNVLVMNTGPMFHVFNGCNGGVLCRTFPVTQLGRDSAQKQP
eukprot:1151724-Pelagomonas_calceolata.AAC.6